MEASAPQPPPPPAPDPPAKGDVSVGKVINETFSVYGDNLGPLIGSALIVFVVVGLVSALLSSAGGIILGLLAVIVSLIGQAIYIGFVVNLVEDVRDGRRDHSMGDLFSAASPAIAPLIGFGILFAIGVGIGFILLIIPGLFLITMWSVGAPAIVVERIGVFDAFGRSWGLVKQDGWSVFGSLLVTLIIVIAIKLILDLIGAAIGVGGLIVANIIAGAVTAPIFAIAVTVIYFELSGGFQAAPAAAPAPSPIQE